MLGPLLNSSGIANAQSQLFLNKSPYYHINLPSNNDNKQISYSNSQAESKHRSSISSLSLISADHYADIEWPVKKALTFGYANYASREELIKYSTTTQSSDINLGANSLKNSQNNMFETNGQIATYYFKLFPSFYSTAKTNVTSYYFNDKKKNKFNKNKKKQSSNTRKSYKERIGADKSSKNSNKLNFFNINEDPYLKSSPSSSSSSRRSSTDNEINANVNKSKKNIDNNHINEIKLNNKLTEVKKLKKKNLIDKNNDLLIDDNDISLMSSSESLYKQILEEIQDENLVAEEEVLDEDEDDEFNVFNDLNDLENNSTNSNQQNKNVLYELIDRDKNDKQLLDSLMQNSAHFKDLSQRLSENYFNISEFSHSSKTSNSPSNLTVSSLIPETPSHNLFNSKNTSSHKKISKKNNSDVDNQFNFLENQNFNKHFNHYYELLDDSEEDDDTDQFITTISIAKKNRNARHSKPFADVNSGSLQENSLIKKDDDDFVIFESDNNSLKKRRELKSETLPKPAALQSSSNVNHWINSTSLPIINTEKSSSTPTTFINNFSSLISSNFSSLNNTKNKEVDRPTLSSARSWKTILFLTLKIIAICTVILLAIFGNLLVIISVLRHHKLRITTNYFVVSLACADILVALFAMTFKASLAIQGSWMFGQLVCDLWNSCDVLFSTASIMHLCCISVDRYYAIIKPLDYPMKITNKFVFIMLTVVWISSTLISFIPIFTGIYTTKEFLEYQKTHPDECEFHVNPYYALISSTVSFWLPCMVMLFTYYRIYLEATRQEKLLYESQMIPRHQHRGKKNNQKKQTKSSNVPSKSKQLTSTHTNNTNNLNNRNSNNNNYNQINLNQDNKNDEVPISKTNLPETTATGHNGARLSNTSTTTTATTISTSTTTTASKSSNGITQQATTHVTQAESNNRNLEDINNQRKISSASATNSINELPNSQSIELNNSQLNLSTRDPTTSNPQPPQNISIQSVNSDQNINKNTHRNSHGDDTESGQSTPTKRNINRMRREHKAAKTLGIIMGAFFICWLPFFTVYIVLSVCGSSCDFFPTVVVDFLFWIGYFNSSLNPIIYAYFNREFREAFKETIQNVFCCCIYKVECMRNIRYQLARQNPDRVKNNMNAINYARRNTTASYTGQFNNMLGPTSGGCTNNSLLNNSNTNINNKNSCQNKLDVTKT